MCLYVVVSWWGNRDQVLLISTQVRGCVVIGWVVSLTDLWHPHFSCLVLFCLLQCSNCFLSYVLCHHRNIAQILSPGPWHEYCVNNITVPIFITVKALEIVLLFQGSLTMCMATSTGPSITTSQQQLWCLCPDGKFIKLMCCLIDVYPVYVS